MKLKFYVYELASMDIIDVIEADTNDKCESIAAERGYMDNDEIAGTYSPAFGFVGGLNP